MFDKTKKSDEGKVQATDVFAGKPIKRSELCNGFPFFQHPIKGTKSTLQKFKELYDLDNLGCEIGMSFDAGLLQYCLWFIKHIKIVTTETGWDHKARHLNNNHITLILLLRHCIKTGSTISVSGKKLNENGIDESRERIYDGPRCSYFT